MDLVRYDKKVVATFNGSSEFLGRGGLHHCDDDPRSKLSVRRRHASQSPRGSPTIVSGAREQERGIGNLVTNFLCPLIQKKLAWDEH